MHSAPLLLGVTAKVPAQVIATAAQLAATLQAPLICVHVDDSRYQLEELPDGTIRSAGIDPDSGDECEQLFPAELARQLAEQLNPLGISWQTRALAGGPAQQLSLLAHRVQAQLIVLGVRNRSAANHLRELLNGSVAVQLSHQQRIPVLLVPATVDGPLTQKPQL